MSIIDNIETLSMKIDDKFFDPKLIDALTLYHSLIQEKKKLRHSLGRPSRSDFVQLTFA